MHAEIFAGKGGAYFWHFKSRNGRVVSDAEAYPTKGNALRAAKSCVKAITNPFPGKPIYWDTTEKNGKTVLRWS